MSLVQFGDLEFLADLVIFDKDGTLIDFESMWGRLAERAVHYLTAGFTNGELERELYATLGYDPQAGRTRPDSPLSIATTSQLWTIAAAILYRHGLPWTDAEDRARRAFAEQNDLPLASLVRLAGDAPALFEDLRSAGVKIAVVTTDHRAPTEETLDILDISHLVDYLVCGDDGISWKPAPDAVLVTCEELEVKLARTAVVGDTMADLLMAERAGAGFRAAVMTGVGDPEQLQAHSDVLLDSIDEMAIVRARRVPDQPVSAGERDAGMVAEEDEP
jgi:phosphoglycolate phosphatase-like HAD superfamily hydrolase